MANATPNRPTPMMTGGIQRVPVRWLMGDRPSCRPMVDGGTPDVDAARVFIGGWFLAVLRFARSPLANAGRLPSDLGSLGLKIQLS
jgi:hypothetical protein